jgi:hypothetical protein
LISLAWSHCFSGGLELQGHGPGELPIRFDLALEAASALALLQRPLLFAEGSCAVGGVIADVPVRGTVTLSRELPHTVVVRHALRFDHNAAGFVRAEGTQTFGDRQLYAAATVIHLAIFGAEPTPRGRARLRPDVRAGWRSLTRTFRLRFEG